MTRERCAVVVLLSAAVHPQSWSARRSSASPPEQPRQAARGWRLPSRWCAVRGRWGAGAGTAPCPGWGPRQCLRSQSLPVMRPCRPLTASGPLHDARTSAENMRCLACIKASGAGSVKAPCPGWARQCPRLRSLLATTTCHLLTASLPLLEAFQLLEHASCAVCCCAQGSWPQRQGQLCIPRPSQVAQGLRQALQARYCGAAGPCSPR